MGRKGCRRRRRRALMRLAEFVRSIKINPPGHGYIDASDVRISRRGNPIGYVRVEPVPQASLGIIDTSADTAAVVTFQAAAEEQPDD